VLALQLAAINAAAQGGGVEEGLEGRARLALRLRGAVERAVAEVAAADERAHVAGARVERHERALEVGRLHPAPGLRGGRARGCRRRRRPARARDLVLVAPFEVRELLLERALGLALQVEVEGRVDLETALVDEVRAGYRAPYLKELSDRVASGELNVEEWLTSDLPTSELVKKIKGVKGAGNYAAENLLKLIGRYDGLALDSWTRAKFFEIRNNGRKANDKKIARYYARFNEWRGLALWCDVTRDWL